MWAEHQGIPKGKKTPGELFDRHAELGFDRSKNQLADVATELHGLLSSHFFKENNILFQLALQLLSPSEWPENKAEFDNIGYCSFAPGVGHAGPADIPKSKPVQARLNQRDRG